MPGPISNTGNTYFNVNECHSFESTSGGTALYPLSSQPCSRRISTHCKVLSLWDLQMLMSSQLSIPRHRPLLIPFTIELSSLVVTRRVKL